MYILLENEKRSKFQSQIKTITYIFLIVFIILLTVFIILIYYINYFLSLQKEQTSEKCFILEKHFKSYKCKDFINCDKANHCEGDEPSCDDIPVEGSCCHYGGSKGDSYECWAVFGTCIDYEILFQYKNETIKSETITCGLDDIQCFDNKNETLLLQNETTCYVIPSIQYLSLTKYSKSDLITLFFLLLFMLVIPFLILNSITLYIQYIQYKKNKYLYFNPFFMHLIKRTNISSAIDRSFYEHDLFDANVLKIINMYEGGKGL